MELKRAGLDTYMSKWESIARGGVCTMCPSIGKWVCACSGRDTGEASTKNTMRLQDMAGILLKGQSALMSKRHTAGADAQMHRLLLIEMARLCGEA